MTEQFSLPILLPSSGYALNNDARICFDAVTTGINNISDGLTNFNQLNVGTPNASNGIINWYNSSNGFYYQIKPNAAPTANRIYSFADVGVDANFVLDAGSQNIAGTKTFTGNLSFVFSLNNANNYFQIINQNSGVSAGAGVFVEVASASTGDPVVQFNNGSGAQFWTIGFDNSDSRKFKLSASSALGTTDEFVLDTSGNGTFTGSISGTTGSFSGAISITPVSNQLVLGATRTVTLTAPTPATTSRTITFPDLTGDYSVIGTIGTQTIGGSKTFSSSLILPNGSVSSPSWNLGDTATGSYRTGSNRIGFSLNSVLAAEFLTTGTADLTAYAPLALYAGGGTSKYCFLTMESATGIASTAVEIAECNNGGLLLVFGDDGSGNQFFDLLAYSAASGIAPSVIKSFTVKGSPTARTYTQPSVSATKLSMASGTYTVRTLGFDIAPR